MSHEGISRLRSNQTREQRSFSISDRDNAIPEIKPHLESLLEQMREKIDSHTYDMIVCEGTSAILPTYVLGRAIGDIYKERAYPYPTYIRLHGDRYSFDPQMYKFENRKVKKNILSKKHDKALIITDTVVDGGSIRNATRFLSDHGISSDVAAILCRYSKGAYSLPEGTQLFASGRWHSSEDNLIIYACPIYTGRGRKEHTGSILTDTITQETMAHVWPQAQQLRHELVEAYLRERLV